MPQSTLDAPHMLPNSMKIERNDAPLIHVRCALCIAFAGNALHVTAISLSRIKPSTTYHLTPSVSTKPRATNSLKKLSRSGNAKSSPTLKPRRIDAAPRTNSFIAYASLSWIVFALPSMPMDTSGITTWASAFDNCSFLETAFAVATPDKVISHSMSDAAVLDASLDSVVLMDEMAKSTDG